MKEIAEKEVAKEPHLSQCSECLEDVIAYSLNRLKPMYAISDTGHIITEVNLTMPGLRAQVLAIVHEAIKKVKEHPRHSI